MLVPGLYHLCLVVFLVAGLWVLWCWCGMLLTFICLLYFSGNGNLSLLIRGHLFHFLVSISLFEGNWSFDSTVVVFSWGLLRDGAVTGWWPDHNGAVIPSAWCTRCALQPHSQPWKNHQIEAKSEEHWRVQTRCVQTCGCHLTTAAGTHNCAHVRWENKL